MAKKRSAEGVALEAWELRSRDSVRALELVDEALEAAGTTGCSAARGWAVLTRAFVLMLRARYDDAWQDASEALEIFRAASHADGEAAALFVQGVVCRWTGRPDDGIALYNASLEISRRTGNGALEAATLNGLGNMIRTGGDLEKGLAYFTSSRDAAVRGRAREAESNAIYGIGTTYLEMGNDALARSYLDEAAAIAREQSNNSLLAAIDSTLAQIVGHSGDVATALRYELDALKAVEALEDPLGMSICLLNIGDHYISLGEYDCALDSLMKALDVCREHRLEGDEAIALIRIGRLYERFEDNPIVIDYYRRSLAIARRIGDNFSEVYALFYLGRFYRSCGEEPKALAYFLKCLRMQQKSKQRPGEGSALQAIGATYGMIGEYSIAREYLRKSLEIANEVVDTEAIIRSLVASGTLEIEAGAPEAAFPFLLEALEITRSLGNLDLSRFVLAELISASRAVGDRTRRIEFERQLQKINETIFNAGSRRRVTTLINRFRGEHVRREGEMLGLDDDDLALLDSAVESWQGRVSRRGKAGSSTPQRPASRSVRSETPPRSIDQTRCRIRVETFGALRVQVDGRLLGKGSWYRKRARDLFKLLLINHRSAVTVDEIQEKLWGEHTDRDIESLVMNAASHIRNALGIGSEPGAPEGWLIRIEDAYLLDLGDDATIDFPEFRDLIVAARASDTVSERKRLYAAAAALYRGDFLPEDLPAEWTDFQRQILKDAWFEAMEYLAREHLRDREHDQAIDLSRQILERDDTSESAWHILLLALTERGRTSEAQRAWQQCVERFRRDTGGEPPGWLGEVVRNKSALDDNTSTGN